MLVFIPVCEGRKRDEKAKVKNYYMYGEQNYWSDRISRDSNHSDIQHDQRMIALNMDIEYKLMQMLKPSITKDGDQWCVLFGNDLQEGVAGFGDTPYKAMLAFNKAWNEK